MGADTPRSNVTDTPKRDDVPAWALAKATEALPCVCKSPYQCQRFCPASFRTAVARLLAEERARSEALRAEVEAMRAEVEDYANARQIDCEMGAEVQRRLAQLGIVQPYLLDAINILAAKIDAARRGEGKR